MAGSWEVTDGNQTWRVSQAEYADMVQNRPDYLPKLTVKSKGRMRANIETEEGTTDALVDPEVIAHRAKYGQNISSTPESIDRARQDDIRRTKIAMAEQENLTSFANAALPGAQWIQNGLVGKDAATEARQELSVNSIATLGGNLAEFMIGGKIAGMAGSALLGTARAAKLGTALGFGKEAGLVGRTGRLIAEDVAVETHLYTQTLLDTNKEFVAEDWAQQVGIGMFMASPLILGGVGRAAALAVAAKVGPGLGGKLSQLGDVMGTVAVVSVPHSMKSAVYARGAAAAHIAGRVMRRVGRKAKGKGLGVSDELLKRQDDLLDNLDHSGSFTPERVARMAPGKRAQFLEDYKKYADGDTSFLDEIDWDSINDIGLMRPQIKGVRKQVLTIHRRFKGELKEVKMSTVGYTRALNKANELLKHTEEVGMADAKAALQRGIVAGGDASTMQRSLFEAKINARLRSGVDGGADIVDAEITKLLLDVDTFGAAQVKKNARALEALDGVVDVWDSLGDVTVPKHLEQLELADGVALGNTHGKIDQLRNNMAELEKHGLVSDDQIRGIETKLIEANDTLKRGTKGYLEAIRINKNRAQTNRALKKLQDLSIDVPTTAEGFNAQKAAMVAESAGDLVQLGLKTGKVLAGGIAKLADPGMVTPLIRGVAGLSQLSLEEKHATFNVIQQELPTMTGNPMYTIEKLAPILDRGAAADPVGADMAGAKIVNTMYWLASQMPKMDQTVYGRGLPTPTTLVEEYLEKHFAAMDPLSVGFAVLQGRVTPSMTDAVRVTAPAMYGEMMALFAGELNKIDAHSADPKVVASIGLFMGGLDPMYSGDFLMQIQSSWAQTTTQDGMMQQGGVNNMPNQKDPGQSPYTTSQGQQS